MTAAAPALAERIAGAGRLAGSHAAAAAGGVSETTGRAVKGEGSTGWAIVGYAFALILLYVVVADKPVVAAGSKLIGGVQTATEAFVDPVDPVKLLTERFHYSPTSSTTGAGAPAPAPGANAGPSAGGTLPPAPGSITLPATSPNTWKGVPKPLLEKVLKVAERNARLVKAGKLTEAAAARAEEALVPRNQYPAFYGG